MGVSYPQLEAELLLRRLRISLKRKGAQNSWPRMDKRANDTSDDSEASVVASFQRLKSLTVEVAEHRPTNKFRTAKCH